MQPGDRIAGRYRLIERIGAGGMGEVWRAEQEKLGRAVAIKLIHHEGEDTSARERFEREAELAARVDHRNVVDIIEYGETDDGDPYLVMPHLRGETLAARLARSPRPTPFELAGWMRGVLSGLAAIHDEGIVHRDLKPGNVFLAEDADGVLPKLLDFGISRAVGKQKSGSLTQLGTAIGTPEYMAPEQFESARDVDARADVYGAGAILYEALAGHPPFDGADAFAVYRAVLSKAVPDLGGMRPDLPAPLIALVHRALAKEPADRFPHAREMRDALDAIAFDAIDRGALSGTASLDEAPLALTVPKAVPKTVAMQAGAAAHTRVAKTRAMSVSAVDATAPLSEEDAALGVAETVGVADTVAPAVIVAQPSDGRPTARSGEAAEGGGRPSGGGATKTIEEGGATEVDRAPARARSRSGESTIEPAPRSSATAWVVSVAVLALAGGGYAYWQRWGDSGEVPSIEAVPPDVSEDAGAAAEPVAAGQRVAGPDRLHVLARAWARLGPSERAIDVRLTPSAGQWALVTPPEVAAADAARLATALGGTAAPHDPDLERALRPRVLSTTARINLHSGPDARSTTLRVLAHDTLVVGLYGMIDGAASSAEGTRAVTYFVVSDNEAGWARSRFLSEHAGCVPNADTFIDAAELDREAAREDATFARTHVDLTGVRTPVWLAVARDRRAGRSAVALYRAESGCELGPSISVRHIDGVADEVFFTETARTGGQSLLLVSRHPGTSPPADGVLEWAGYLIEDEGAVWTERLPTAAFLDRRRGGAVSGSRDRIVRTQAEHYVMTIRRPGEPRAWYRWSDVDLEIAPADPPASEESPASTSEGE